MRTKYYPVDMVSGRFDVNEVLEAVYDSDFSLSEGQSSEDEDGDDFYAYLGDPVVDRDSISALTDRLTIDVTDADATVEDCMEDDGYTGEDDEPTDEEWSELHAGEARATGLKPLNGNDNDGLFAATSRASGETANSHESSCESMNTDMHEPSPDCSSDEAQLYDSSLASVSPSSGGSHTRRGRGSTARNASGRAHAGACLAIAGRPEPI